MRRDRSFDEQLGERIAVFRIGKGLTQGGLAAMIDLGQSQLSMFERGRISVAPKHLAALAVALGVSADMLLDLGGDEALHHYVADVNTRRVATDVAERLTRLVVSLEATIHGLRQAGEIVDGGA